jgi:cobalt-zinc-cadmium efflux system membrane fusion protein
MPIHEHTPSSLGRGFLWGGIALGLLLIALLYTHGFGLWVGSPKPEPAPPLVRQGETISIPEGSPLRRRLTVMQVSIQPVDDKRVLPAVVESDPARTASVLPPLGGRVLQLKVALGDRVKAGQVVAVIDSPDLGQAYDDNDKAADTYELSRKTLDRQQEQFKLGTASTRDVDQARSDFNQASAEYTRTQAHLKAIGVPLDAKDRARVLAVTAPVSGSVTSLGIAPGNMINDPTLPMMTIADLSTIWVTAMVSEKDVADIKKQQDVDVSLGAYPDRTLHGKVLFVSDVIEPDSRRDKIRIAFANTDYSLKPNMFATVTLHAAGQTRVVVPTSALLMNNDRTSVFVATAPWTFERRTVEPRLEEGTSVAIDSGLKAGDQVVVKGGILLND